jgi:RNA polymerase sigma-70 factor (ECF subfamily)
MRELELTRQDDLALVERARSGDRGAFAELVRRHQRAALRVAAVISGSTEEAKDIVQDAFVAIHGHLGSFRGAGTVRSWILRVVANTAKNRLRTIDRRRRREERVGGLELIAEADTDELAERRLAAESLATAFALLAVTDREVLGCRFLAGLSEAETAETLGIPAGTVKSRTARALDRLGLSLGDIRGEVGS